MTWQPLGYRQNAMFPPDTLSEDAANRVVVHVLAEPSPVRNLTPWRSHGHLSAALSARGALGRRNESLKLRDSLLERVNSTREGFDGTGLRPSETGNAGGKHKGR